MFDKNRFANILKKINDSYDNQVSFAKASGVNRTYLSQYMNVKLDSPPTPKILMGIANASKGITNYYELMEICDYIDIDTNMHNINNSISIKSKEEFYTVPVFISQNGALYPSSEDVVLPLNLDHTHSYFGYKTADESMSPLLGISDIAIIEKTDKFSDGNTCLISLDNKIIFIRKILDLKTHIELQPINYTFDTIKLTKDDMNKRNFIILGRVIKAENQSSF